jgi:hypothetical protein
VNIGLLILKKAVSHRDHRDHRVKTKACITRAIHLFGEANKREETTSFSVNSVA